MANSICMIIDESKKLLGTTFSICNKDKKSYFVTAAHVVDDLNNTKIYIKNQDVTIEDIDQHIDLAILSIDIDNSITPLKIYDKIITNEPLEVQGYSDFTDSSYRSKKIDCELIDIFSKISKKNNNKYNLLEIGTTNKFLKFLNGLSGSPLIATKSNYVIGIITARNTNNNQIAYAVPIYLIKKMLNSICQDIFVDDSFTNSLFQHQNYHPVILYYTDNYNYKYYLDLVKKRAEKEYGKECIIEFNCTKLVNIKDESTFYKELSSQQGFSKQYDSAYKFFKEIENKISNSSKNYILLIYGLEKLENSIFSSITNGIRALIDNNTDNLKLIIFGGKKVVALKYENRELSLFNFFEIKKLPEIDYAFYKKTYKTLKYKVYKEIIKVTGNHSKLTEHCIRKNVTTSKEAKDAIENSSLPQELFIKYSIDELKELNLENLGRGHIYSNNKLLRELFWDDILIIEDGSFKFRSSFIKELAKEYIEENR